MSYLIHENIAQLFSALHSNYEAQINYLISYDQYMMQYQKNIFENILILKTILKSQCKLLIFNDMVNIFFFLNLNYYIQYQFNLLKIKEEA